MFWAIMRVLSQTYIYIQSCWFPGESLLHEEESSGETEHSLSGGNRRQHRVSSVICIKIVCMILNIA